jgi:pimeloyl-ACP methyl ester carboxylesterase
MKGLSKTQTLDAARRFTDFTQPVLVVWAGQDRLFAHSLGKRLAAAFPHGAILTGFLAPDAAR